MTGPVISDSYVNQILQSRGIDAKQGVFGNHTVRLGNQPAVRLDKVSASKVPFLGFRSATRLQSAKNGQTAQMNELFNALTKDTGIDAKGVVKALKTLVEYRHYLGGLNHENTFANDLKEVLRGMDPVKQARLFSAMLSDEFRVLELSLRREAGLDAKSESLNKAGSLLQDLRAQVTGLSGNAIINKDLLSTLTAPGEFNEKTFTQMFKIAERYAQRLVENKTITAEQKGDYLFRFAPNIQNMSNTELSGMWQKLNSAQVQLMQNRLMASDEPMDRRQAEMLFMLNGLVLKEIGNRVANGRVDQEIEKDPNTAEELNKLRPKALTEQFAGNANPLPEAPQSHDISTANLELLTEATSRTATYRERTEGQREHVMAGRGITMTSKEAGDLMRNAPITINFGSRRLISTEGILYNPDKPMENIFHLQARGVHPKGVQYNQLRDQVEKTYFPQFEGHDIDPAERPTYGALNIFGSKIGAAYYGYGSCCIVLKPHVKQRATFSFDDSFNSAKAVVTPERIQALRKLLQAELPAEAASQIADPNSQPARALEVIFNDLMNLQNSGQPVTSEKLTNYKIFGKTETDWVFHRLLVKAFCDSEQVQKTLATQENIEVLFDQMDSVTQNSIGRGIEKARETGESPKAMVAHNYIEAQIHGELIPSRDFEELIISTGDIAKDKLPEIIRQAELFEKRTGVKVTLLSDQQVGESLNQANERTAEDVKFAHDHINPQEVRRILDERVNDKTLEARLFNILDGYLGIQNRKILFPNGIQDFTKEQRDGLVEDIRSMAEQFRTDPNSTEKIEEVVESAIAEGIKRMIGLQGLSEKRRTAKVAGLKELAQAKLPNEAMRTAFTKWVVGARKLRSIEEFRTILEHTVSLTEKLSGLMRQEKTPSTNDLLTVFADFYKNASPDFSKALKNASPDYGRDDFIAEFTRCASLATSALISGEKPLLSKEQADQFFALINTPEFGRDLLILASVKPKGALDSLRMPLMDTGTITLYSLQEIGHRAHRELNLNLVEGLDCRFLSESTRNLMKEKFPDCSAYLESVGKIVKPAVAANGQPVAGMPATHAQRRNFLITMLDQHLEKERNGVERGRYDHGRGHIARTFILGNAVAGFMNDLGVKVDRNLLLCGIAGHDSGRKGGGDDMYESVSADNTVKSLRAFTKTDSLGEEFEAEVRDLIIQHNKKDQPRPHPDNETTVERMLLASADSLEIGRVIGRQGIDLGRNALLHPLDKGESRSDNVNKFLSGLADEADILQKLTNPRCRMQNEIEANLIEMNMPGTSDKRRNELNARNQEIDRQNLAEFERQQTLTSEQYMSFIESTIRENAPLFPLLSKYYFTQENGNLERSNQINGVYDRTRLENEKNLYLSQIQAHLAARMNLQQIIPAGSDVLTGAALRAFQNDLEHEIGMLATNAEIHYASEQELVAAAFDHVSRNHIGIRRACIVKASALKFSNQNQKAAFLHWVQSESRLQSDKEITLVHAQATRLANVFAQMAQENAMTEENLARNLMTFFNKIEGQVGNLVQELTGGRAPDDINAQFNRIFSMSWTMLTAGNPPMLAPELQGRVTAAFSAQLEQHVANLATVIRPLRQAPNRLPDVDKALAFTQLISNCSRRVRRSAQLPRLAAPEGSNRVGDVPKSLRRVLRELAPQTAQALRF